MEIDMHIDGNHLIIENDLGDDYEILLKLLETPSGLESWLCHMTEKSWFSMEMAKEMKRICENHFGYEFNGRYSYGAKNENI
jgi:hypothetical protein